MTSPTTGVSYEPLLSTIANFLSTNLTTTGVKASGNSYYHIHASSVKSITILKEYLDVHSLYSSKYLDYQDWRTAVNLIINQPFGHAVYKRPRPCGVTLY